MFVLIIAIGTTAIMSVNLAGIWNGPIFIMLPILFLYGVAAILMGYLVSHFVNGPLKSFLAMAMISLVMFAISTIAFSVGPHSRQIICSRCSCFIDRFWLL